MMVASGRKQAARPLGAAVVTAVALLLAAAAHPSSAHASTGGRSPSSSPCVRMTSAALSSSCLPGADVEYFTFAMEGTAGADNGNYRDLDTEDGPSRAIIAARAGESIAPCTATDVTVTVGFAAPVISVAYPWGATISGASMVTFFVETLESNSTEFAVVLDTTGVAVGTNAVTYVSYSDNEGNFPDMSGLMAVASAAPECGRYAAAAAATEVRRKLQSKEGEYSYGDCDVCANLSSAQLEALGMYDNGGKEIVCDPTCLDGVSDPTHCNYFGLGQICRGCGDCSTCAPCPDPDKTPAPTPKLTEPPTSLPTPAGTPSPTPFTAVASTGPPSTRVVGNDDGDDDDDSDSDDGDDDNAVELDCTPCTSLSDDQLEALTMYDRGGKKIVCDPTCLDGVTDSTHCNYFGLGQMCRGCGSCPTCTPCP